MSKTTAQDNGVSETMDALERRLELGRHEEFLRSRSNTDSELAGFTTDGCSGGLSGGWEYLSSRVENLRAIHGDRPPWESCCVEHDRAYHVGGDPDFDAEQSFLARREADLALQACVLVTGETRVPELSAEYDLSEEQVLTLYQAVASLMYRSVRLGGIPCSGLPWRWGYGWPRCD